MRINTSSNGRHARQWMAYTLIEVLASVFVLALVFAGFYLTLSKGFNIVEVSRENLRATQVLQQQMETIRLYTWDQINSNGFIPSTFTAPFNPVGTSSTNAQVFNGSIVITNAPMTETYVTNHVLVTVTVSWLSADASQHQRQISTIVSQFGLHNYYY